MLYYIIIITVYLQVWGWKKNCVKPSGSRVCSKAAYKLTSLMSFNG